MHQSIDGRRGGHRIFEDPLPFGKDEIAGQQHAMTLVAMGQQGEQDFHFVTALLHIAEVVNYQGLISIQPLQFFLQPEFGFGQQ